MLWSNKVILFILTYSCHLLSIFTSYNLLKSHQSVFISVCGQHGITCSFKQMRSTFLNIMFQSEALICRLCQILVGGKLCIYFYYFLSKVYVNQWRLDICSLSGNVWVGFSVTCRSCWKCWIFICLHLHYRESSPVSPVLCGSLRKSMLRLDRSCFFFLW